MFAMSLWHGWIKPWQEKRRPKALKKSEPVRSPAERELQRALEAAPDLETSTNRVLRTVREEIQRLNQERARIERGEFSAGGFSTYTTEITVTESPNGRAQARVTTTQPTPQPDPQPAATPAAPPAEPVKSRFDLMDEDPLV